MTTDIFQSYIMGGFECSTHRSHTGKRIDVIAATMHERYAESDYRRMIDLKIRTARDGVRWHLVEQTPYQYDWSSVINQIRAARQTGVQIIWDLFHYGYPDDLDLLSAEFIDRFSAFAEEFVKLLIAEGETKPLICLINEISFFSWAAGEVGFFYPFMNGCGDQVKRQLARASIAAAEKVKRIAPKIVLIQTDPAIRVFPSAPEHIADARNQHDAQFQALDLLFGKAEPELGGDAALTDVIGVNFYPYNQWLHPGGARILQHQEDYYPLSEILKEFYERYQKPLFISETGTEDDGRAQWFRYVCEQVRIAQSSGIPVYGICLYPIVNHPGWDDDRHCHNGLWDYPNEKGDREIYAPLEFEIKCEMNQICKAYAA